MKKFYVGICYAIFILILFIVFIKFNNSDISDGNVEIEFLKTSVSDNCILLTQNDCCTIIDPEIYENGNELITELRKRNISKIDLLILSHNDEAFFCGAEKLCAEFKIVKVFEAPNAPVTEYIQNVNAKLKAESARIVYPVHNMNVHLGTMDYIIYPAYKSHYEDERNHSLFTLFKYKDTDCVFLSDSVKQRANEFLSSRIKDIDLYVLPNNGKANSFSDELFEMLKPKFAVVLNDKIDNKIEAIAKDNNTELFCTKNSLSFIDDGTKIVKK